MSSRASLQNPPGTPVPKRRINVRKQRSLRSLPALPFSIKNRPGLPGFQYRTTCSSYAYGYTYRARNCWQRKGKGNFYSFHFTLLTKKLLKTYIFPTSELLVKGPRGSRLFFPFSGGAVERAHWGKCPTSIWY